MERVVSGGVNVRVYRRWTPIMCDGNKMPERNPRKVLMI